MAANRAEAAQPRSSPSTPVVVLPALAASLVVLGFLDALGDYAPVRGPFIGDHPAPAIDALVDGRFGDFLAQHPWMGSFSLYLRWPFAALGEALGASNLIVYKLGVLPCL